MESTVRTGVGAPGVTGPGSQKPPAIGSCRSLSCTGFVPPPRTHVLTLASSAQHAHRCRSVAALHSQEGDANWTSLGQGSTFDPTTLARMSGSQSIKMTSSQPLRAGRRFWERGGWWGGAGAPGKCPR
uniref:Uncharacterized protein n=1 Tax=Molossus molossus TaxID=27622 RepID=A0A7J8C913_MOLMO|nr:hypothetical protein HJG59_009980 [Molossus molossus]